jgi:hypothetical protein
VSEEGTFAVVSSDDVRSMFHDFASSLALYSW